jgi:hypothetical protein
MPTLYEHRSATRLPHRYTSRATTCQAEQRHHHPSFEPPSTHNESTSPTCLLHSGNAQFLLAPIPFADIAELLLRVLERRSRPQLNGGGL